MIIFLGATDLEKTQSIIDKLIDKEILTKEEQKYLQLLGIVVNSYEEQLELVSDIYGVDLLKVLMVETNLKQKDLVPIFKTESIVSAVLNGKRKLTAEHIHGLAKFFKVPHSVFFPKI